MRAVILPDVSVIVTNLVTVRIVLLTKMAVLLTIMVTIQADLLTQKTRTVYISNLINKVAESNFKNFLVKNIKIQKGKYCYQKRQKKGQKRQVKKRRR